MYMLRERKKEEKQSNLNVFLMSHESVLHHTIHASRPFRNGDAVSGGYLGCILAGLRDVEAEQRFALGEERKRDGAEEGGEASEEVVVLGGREERRADEELGRETAETPHVELGGVTGELGAKIKKR